MPAEQLEFGDVSTGAEDDLKQATELATNMVAHYGMSERLGPVYYDHKSEQPFLGRRIATDGGTSDATAYVIEQEVRRLIADALSAATTVLDRNRRVLERLVVALLERETLERRDLDAVLGAPILDAVPA